MLIILNKQNLNIKTELLGRNDLSTEEVLNIADSDLLLEVGVYNPQGGLYPVFKGVLKRVPCFLGCLSVSSFEIVLLQNIGRLSGNKTTQ